MPLILASFFLLNLNLNLNLNLYSPYMTKRGKLGNWEAGNLGKRVKLGSCEKKMVIVIAHW
jgi:hypothetical protein